MLQKATNSLKLKHMNFEAKQPRFKCCIYYFLQALFGDITLLYTLSSYSVNCVEQCHLLHRIVVRRKSENACQLLRKDPCA